MVLERDVGQVPDAHEVELRDLQLVVADAVAAPVTHGPDELQRGRRVRICNGRNVLAIHAKRYRPGISRRVTRGHSHTRLGAGASGAERAINTAMNDVRRH